MRLLKLCGSRLFHRLGRHAAPFDGFLSVVEGGLKIGVHDSDFSIVATYQAEYWGLVQYYLLAQDVARLNRLQWVMETSMLKTLASKHRSTVTKMARKYKATIDTPDGPRKCFEVIVERGGEKKALVARFGGIPLKRQRTAVMADQEPLKPNNISTTRVGEAAPRGLLRDVRINEPD
ncbi:group II intron reverse transcriptase/maturase [Streptomyces sp. NPDC006668]|uniref:group II intron reverse transcriptase/maturase n=1 Tax=Streptomyces sp. NPDC006668 TaxID=3156903 RepID=UPI0034092FFD